MNKEDSFHKLVKEARFQYEVHSQSLNDLSLQKGICNESMRNILSQIDKWKQKLIAVFDNVNEKVINLFQSLIYDGYDDILNKLQILSSQSPDIENYHLYKSFSINPFQFSEVQLNLQRKQEELEESLAEFILKLDSICQPLLYLHEDIDEKTSKMNLGQLDESQHLQLQGNLIGHENVVRSCIQLFDGDFATGSRDKTIRIWNHKTWQCTQIIRDHQNWVQDLINIEKYFCSCSDDKKIKIFGKNERQISLLTAQFAKNQEHEDKSWSCILTLVGHESYVMRLQYNRLNNMIISCSSDGTLKLWSFESNLKDIRKDEKYSFETLKGHSNCVYSLYSKNEDDTIISGDEGGELIKWNIKQKKIINKQEEGHLGCVNFISSLTNSNILTSGDDKLLKMWDKELKSVLNQLYLNRSEIECFNLIDDNKLMGGDEQGYIVLIDLEVGEVVMEKVSHKDRIYKLNRYSNDLICSSSTDHTAKIWRLSIF